MKRNRVFDRKMKELARFAAHDDDLPAKVSPEFSARVNRLLSREDTKFRRHANLLRTAAVFAVLLAGLSVFLAVNTESRAGFRDWVVEKYRKSLA